MFSLSLALGIGAVFFFRPLLAWMNCPSEAYTAAASYMLISCIGFPFVFGYNAICSVLRAMGESKWPLAFICVAAVTNIILDILLVAVFELGAAGTAIATVFSQFASFSAAALYLYHFREKFGFEFKLSFFKPDFDILKILIKLGIPQIVRSTFVRFSMMWVNSNINVYGLTISATNSVGNKIQHFAEVFIQGVDSASAAMLGQNLGAKKHKRASHIVWATVSTCLCWAGVACVICLLFPQQLFGIFTSDSDVISFGVTYLNIMVLHFFVSALTGSFQAMVTASGFVTFGFWIGILDGVVCRIGISLFFLHVLDMGALSYFWGTALSRTLPAVITFAYFISGNWKTRKLLSEK